MKSFTQIVSVLSLLLFSEAAIVQELPFSARISDAAKEELQRKIEEAGGCNGNICFAIDGSSSISDTEFENQKNFILDVSSVIGVDYPVELAAVQYATKNSAITPMTPNSAFFNLAVEETEQMGGKSFVVAGINYCFSQLIKRRGEALKIVLLGDGRSNIGGDSIKRANLFRRLGGDVSVVGAGFEDSTQLLGIAGGKHDHVFEVDSFLDVLVLQGFLEALTAQICK